MSKKNGNLGKKRSEESRKKMSEKAKARRWPPEHKQKISNTLKGVNAGDKNPRWVKDRSKLSKRRDRRSPAFYEWRTKVRKRDNSQCRLKSHECAGRLEVHHIFNWADYPELRYVVNNGIVLCKFHHPLKWDEEKRMIPIFQEIISNL